MLLAYLQGDVPRARRATDRVLTAFPDPEFHFYSALLLAHFGELDRSLEVLAGAVERGYFPLTTVQGHHWLDAVRDRAEFHAIEHETERRHRNAARAFLAADGVRLLGVTPVAV